MAFLSMFHLSQFQRDFNAENQIIGFKCNSPPRVKPVVDWKP